MDKLQWQGKEAVANGLTFIVRENQKYSITYNLTILDSETRELRFYKGRFREIMRLRKCAETWLKANG